MRFFTFITSSPKANKLAVTSEEIRNYKDVLTNMKGRKMNATAMLLITNETIYRVTVEVASKAIRILKKVIRQGACQYKPGSKADRLITTFQKVHAEYKEMLLKMEIKMMPSKAEYVIECWLKKDAAEKAAKECKDRKALEKEEVEDSYFRMPDPEPESWPVIKVITEIYV